MRTVEGGGVRRDAVGTTSHLRLRRWPLAPLRPKRAACGVAGLRLREIAYEFFLGWKDAVRSLLFENKRVRKYLVVARCTEVWLRTRGVPEFSP